MKLRLSVLLFVLTSFVAFADQPSEEFLKKQLSFTEDDLRDLRAGKAVSKILETKDNQEVVVAGAILVHAPKETIATAVRDIASFKKGKEVQAVGKFEKYELDEMKGLSIDDSELQSLKKCKVEDCHWKLPASWIDRIAEEKKDSANFNSSTSTLVRQMFVDYAKQYLSEGNKAMLQFDNDDEPLRSGDQFQNIIGRSTFLEAHAPEFHEYLKQFPEKELPGESYIYWSKEKFGFKPVISLTHVTIYPRSPEEVMIASKQIYANHYFNGSLSVTFLFDHSLADGTTGCYLVYVNRSRIDALDGFLSSIRRAIAIPRIRKGLDSNLKLLRDRMEEKAKSDQK